MSDKESLEPVADIASQTQEMDSPAFFPLVWILVGLAAGIGIAEWADVRLMAAALIFLLVPGIWRNRMALLLAAGALVLGFIYWSAAHPVAPTRAGEFVGRSEMVVLERPQFKDDGWRFQGQLVQEDLRVRVFYAGKVSIRKGDHLTVSGTLRDIKGASNPGEFDFKEFWAHRGIFYNLILDEGGVLAVSGHETNPFRLLLESIIARGQQSIRGSMEPAEAVIMEGMLFGFQGEISDEQFADFQKSGLVHVFSVSGFHTGFIVLIGIWLAQLLSRRRSVRLGIVVGLLILYGCLTGWPSPMIRASLMAALALTAHYLGRDQDLPTSLALSGIIILLINPANLFEISFQLSFLAAAGIIVLYPRWRDRLGAPKRWQQMVLLSLAPQAATLPIAVYYFNLVSLIAVAANLLLVNVAGVAVILGFAGVALAQFSQGLASLTMVPAGFLTRLVAWGAAWFGGLPGGYLWVARPEVWMILMAYAGMALLWMPELERGMARALRRIDMENIVPNTRLIGGLMVGLFLVLILIPGNWRDPGRLKVVFIDVGQGDSIFIKTPGGYTILIDGGGSEFTDVGRKVVLPFLRRQGIRHLDLAVATHPHVDHLQGLKSVLLECPAEVVVAGRGCFDSQAEAGGRLIILEGRCVFSPDDSTRIWLWAPPGDEIREIGNETSVAARIALGKVSFLLTGDGGPPELALLAREGLSLESTVLKLSHHGSKYSWSDEFADQVNAGIGVVCVGARNPFGHPDAGVMEKARQRGMEIYRTDQEGAVTFLTGGSDLSIETGP